MRERARERLSEWVSDRANGKADKSRRSFSQLRKTEIRPHQQPNSMLTNTRTSIQRNYIRFVLHRMWARKGNTLCSMQALSLCSSRWIFRFFQTINSFYVFRCLVPATHVHLALYCDSFLAILTRFAHPLASMRCFANGESKNCSNSLRQPLPFLSILCCVNSKISLVLQSGLR